MATSSPPLCLSCNRVNMGAEFVQLRAQYKVEDGWDDATLLDLLGVNQLCCRATAITYCDMRPKLQEAHRHE